MIGVAGFTVTQQPAFTAGGRVEQRETRRLTDGDAIASASAGRQMSGEISCSELKPYSVVRQRLSTPPTTAASQAPASMARRAAANTLALEEQAVEILSAGPRSDRRRVTNSVIE